MVRSTEGEGDRAARKQVERSVPTRSPSPSLLRIIDLSRARAGEVTP